MALPCAMAFGALTRVGAIAVLPWPSQLAVVPLLFLTCLGLVERRALWRDAELLRTQFRGEPAIAMQDER